MITIGHGYYEQPEYIEEQSDVEEAIERFNAQNDGYVACLTEFKNHEDYTIEVEHEDAEGIVEPNGTFYLSSQLEDWTRAYDAHAEASTLDENGNIPRFTPTLDDGDIVA